MNSSNNAKEFLILTKYKEFINILDAVIENIPKKDIYYKNKLKEISINLLYYINKTNNEEDYNKINSYKVEIKSLIELIDYILERLYLKKYISKNSINKLGYKLIEINKMSSKWMENKISYAVKISDLINIYENEIVKGVKNRKKILKFEANKIEYLIYIKNILENISRKKEVIIIYF